MVDVTIFIVGMVFGIWCARCVIKGDGCGYNASPDECDR